MAMRRGITYLLLASNWLIAIAIAICLFFFINKSGDNVSLYDYQKTMRLLIVAPVLAIAISSAMLFLYNFLLKKSLVDLIATMNPKLLTLIKSTSYISLINLFLPSVLTVTSLAVNSNQKDVYVFALLVSAIALSIIIGLIITGYTSYINFRISFNEEKRKALLEGYEPELKMHEDKITYKNEETEKKYKKKQPVDDDSLATSGTF